MTIGPSDTARAPAFTRDEVVAARRRIAGHLVATPTIGGLHLPGASAVADLRLHAELLQPTGSLWYRGAMHWLARQLGRHKGLRLRGSPAAMRAFACAAREARVATVVAAADCADAGLRAELAALDCAVVAAADRGLVPGPERDDRDFALGVATLAVDLDAQLAVDTARVVVAPAELAPAVAAGLAAMGRGMEVLPAPAAHPQADLVRAALLREHRLAAGPQGAAALAWVLAGALSGTCVVLGD